MVSGKTGTIVLIGDPVEHSISPTIHNSAFQELGLDYVYVTLRVSPNSIVEALGGISSLGIKGANVTTPHKTTVLDYMDELHKSASKVGAVNTIKNEDGSLIGFNTDGQGALKALESEIGDVNGQSVILLGAGGAARAIAFSLVEAGANLVISNRTASKAKDLVNSISTETGVEVKQIELGEESLTEEISNSNILINATSVGMEPNTDETLVTADMMHSDLVVNDIVYRPLKTRLLKEAEEAGAKTIGGLGMLVHQGAASLKIWTGEDAPINVMMDAARKAIKEG